MHHECCSFQKHLHQPRQSGPSVELDAYEILESDQIQILDHSQVPPVKPDTPFIQPREDSRLRLEIPVAKANRPRATPRRQVIAQVLQDARSSVPSPASSIRAWSNWRNRAFLRSPRASR